MKRIRDPINAIIFYFTGLAVISFIFFLLPENQKSLINYVTYFGTYTSIFGIMITYAQILSVKEISEDTKLKIEDSLQKTYKILTISELSKSIKLVQEIQNYLLNSKLESAVIRLKDLKSTLIQLKHNNNLDEYTKSSVYSTYLTNISVNTTNLNQHIIGSKTGVNINKIVSNLEDIENHLGEIEGYLKFNSHE